MAQKRLESSARGERASALFKVSRGRIVVPQSAEKSLGSLFKSRFRRR